MPPKTETADSVRLIPLKDFSKVVKRVFATPKAESDRELAAFQAARRSKRKRKAK